MFRVGCGTSRRDFLSGAVSAAVALSTTKAADALQSVFPHHQNGTGSNQEESSTIRPDGGQKFTLEGKVLPFAGNTVIVHLPAQGYFRDAVVALHSDLQQSAFAKKLAILPTDSYHMTIFSGANDLSRETSAWPRDVPLDASMARCNEVLKARLASLSLKGKFPLQVRLDSEATLTFDRACSLRMRGADSDAERNLRSVREQLALSYNNRPRDFDQYAFHITIAYTVSAFSVEESQRYREFLKPHIKNLIQAAPLLELGLPEFCTFDDMYKYNVLKILRVG